MMQTYKALDGQSLYDVCLQTYGSLNYLVKLMTDNNISNLDITSIAGIVFIFDERLTVDMLLAGTNTRTDVIYKTKR